MIDIIGSFVLSIIALFLGVYLLRSVKRVDYAKIIIIIMCFIVFVSALLRFISLVVGMPFLDSSWSVVPLISTLALFFVGLILLFNRFDRLFAVVFFFVAVLMFVLSFVYGFSFYFLLIIFGVVSIVIFSYFYYRYRTRSILFYLLALLFFAFGGFGSGFYYPLIYLFDSIAFILMFLSFKYK
ncbi:MAG TPA: hypothetical protein VI790_03970 [Candidatus Nanoarchaeia archaeon]|nr:hypothetical protein [Candidatus Nanoarchaeia archaeon]